MTRTTHFPALLFVALGALAVASDASAQNKRGGPFTPMKPAIIVPTVGVTNISIDNIKERADVASNGGLDGVPVLSAFRFRFTNGDHQLERFALLTKTPSSAFVAFHDVKPDDPFDMAATWLVVRGGGTRGEVYATGGNQFVVPLPPRPAGTRLVLTGFDISRIDDGNIRLIGVWLDEPSNKVRVSLVTKDPYGIMGNSLGHAVGTGGRPGTVFPSIGAAAASVHDDKSFIADIQYAFIPDSVVAGEAFFTGSGRTADSGKVLPARGGLQGFELDFDNKDHHIMDIGIMPPTAGGIVRSRPSLPTKPDEVIAYQDKNRDDPVKWAAKFVILK